jgi:dTDP-4-dehydrorhamnose reductase
MRLLILGATGMLGRAVHEEARARGVEVLGLSHQQADVRLTGEVERHLAGFGAGVVINCAALTDVDGCEGASDAALEINGRAVAGLAELSRRHGFRLVQISTDYVFDGCSERPYREADPPRPLSVYGASKLLGERAALAAPSSLVVRTSWLFGPGGRNFVATMLAAARAGGELRVVDDQVGAPTYAPFLAAALLDLAERGVAGIVHYRNREPVSWYDYARAILSLWGLENDIRPVATTEFPRPARRPAYSVLEVSRFEALLARPVEPWRQGLIAYRAFCESRVSPRKAGRGRE